MDSPDSPRYTRDHPGYLGAGNDNSHRKFDAFMIGDDIHVVYRMGAPDQFVAKESSAKVLGDMDGYLWTPFAEFARRKPR